MQKFNYPSTREEEKSSPTDDGGRRTLGVEEEVVSARFTPHSPIGEKTDKNKKEGRKGRKTKEGISVSANEWGRRSGHHRRLTVRVRERESERCSRSVVNLVMRLRPPSTTTVLKDEGRGEEERHRRHRRHFCHG